MAAVTFATWLGALSGNAFADDDPPSRVGRLAILDGTVSFHTADQTSWGSATPNYPITNGNALWADTNSHATVQIGSNAVSLAPTTELDVNQLDDQSFQANLPQGEVYLDLRNLNDGDTYQVATPRGTVTINQPGRYEIASGDQAHAGMITVLDGAAQINGDNLNLALGTGQMAVLSDDGKGGPVQASVATAQGDDQLVAWARSREPRQAPPQAADGMTGTQDLAQYGRWSTSPDYGAVWYPQVAADWVPYRAGHWAWVAPWGWTWVDDAPWGFAPFHYGRWVQIGPRWAWAPRPIMVVTEPIPLVPVYAPALVSFIGNIGGVGIGLTIGGPSVGWVPLGPREAYYPTYRVSPRYTRNVNVTYVNNVNIINEHNTTIVNNVTVNHFANRNAVTVVSRDTIIQSRHVPGAIQRVNSHDLDTMHGFAGGQPPLRPTAETAGLTPQAAKQFGVSPQEIQHKQAAGPMLRQSNGNTAANRQDGKWGSVAQQNALAGQTGAKQSQDHQSKLNRWPSDASHKPGAPVQQQPWGDPAQAQHYDRRQPLQTNQATQQPPSRNKTDNTGIPQLSSQQQNLPGAGSSKSRLPGAPVDQGQVNWQQGNRRQQDKLPSVVQQTGKSHQQESRKPAQSDWQQLQHQQNGQAGQYSAQQSQLKDQRAQEQQQRAVQQQQNWQASQVGQQRQHVARQPSTGQTYQPQQVQHANQQGKKPQSPTADQLVPQQ
jgi:hypothetical protein